MVGLLERVLEGRLLEHFALVLEEDLMELLLRGLLGVVEFDYVYFLRVDRTAAFGGVMRRVAGVYWPSLHRILRRPRFHGSDLHLGIVVKVFRAPLLVPSGRVVLVAAVFEHMAGRVSA